MIDLSGVSLWVWYHKPEYIALARQIGARRLLIKAADGRDKWAQLGPAAAACREAGLGVAAWGYHYGEPGEAAVLASQAASAGVYNLIFDPEAEYEARSQQQQRAWAAEVQTVRQEGFGVGICTFGNPDYHGGLDYHALGMAADVFVPMLAWPVWTGRSIDTAIANWNKHLLGNTIPWLPAYSVGAQEFVESVQKCLTAYGGATIWDAAHLTPELVAALTGQPVPSELPERWRQYGHDWPSVAETLLGICNDTLARGRQMDALAQQQRETWGGR